MFYLVAILMINLPIALSFPSTLGQRQQRLFTRITSTNDLAYDERSILSAKESSSILSAASSTVIRSKKNTDSSDVTSRRSKYSPEKKLMRSPWKKMSQPNNLSFNDIEDIEGLLVATAEGYFDFSIEKLHDFHSNKRITTYECNMLLKNIGNIGKLEKCEEIFYFMRDNKIKCTIITYSTIISRAGTWKRTDLAQKMFDYLQTSGIEADVHVYNHLINAYAKAEEAEKALSIFQTMTSKKIKPSIVTFNTLIDAFARCGRAENAQRMLSAIPNYELIPNTRSYSSVIHAWCQVGNIPAALELLKRMEQNGLEPSSITYSIILHALGQLPDSLDSCFKMLESLRQRGVIVNVVTMSSLVHAFAKSGRIDDAFRLYNKMLESPNQDDRPNSITASALIDACLKNGDVERALAVLEDMKMRKIPLTAVTYTSIIAELTKLKMLDRLLEFALQVSDDSINSEVVNYPKSTLFPLSAKSIVKNVAENSEEITRLRCNEKLSRSDAAIKSFVSSLLNSLSSFEFILSEVEIYLRRDRLDENIVSKLIQYERKFEGYILSLSNVKQIYDLLQDSKVLSEVENDQGLSFDNLSKEGLVRDCAKLLRGKIVARKLLDITIVLTGFLDTNVENNSITNYAFIDRIKKILKPTQEQIDAVKEYEYIKTKGSIPGSDLYNSLVQSLYEITVAKADSFDDSGAQQQLRRDDLFRLYLVFQEMRHNGRIHIDAPVYNTLIDACAGAGDIHRALETLQAMLEAGVRPTVITYTSLIKACEIHGGSSMIALAEDLFAEMQQRSNHFSDFIAPTHVTFQHLMQAHLSVPFDDVNTTRVIELFDEMISRGIAPSRKTSRLCIRAAMGANNVERVLSTIELLRKTKSIQFDYHSWFLAMNMCRYMGLAEQEMLLRDEIVLKDLSLLDSGNKQV